jgi:hypothetical protein
VTLADLPVQTYILRSDDLNLAYTAVLLERRNSYGETRWSIRQGSHVLNRNLEWEYEPLPSSRTDEYLERVRFHSPEEALTVWERAVAEGKAES